MYFTLTNKMSIDDASLSSINSYTSQMIDNCFEGASCLATDFGSITNDVLETFYESCITNIMQEISSEKDEDPTSEEDDCYEPRDTNMM